MTTRNAPGTTDRPLSEDRPYDELRVPVAGGELAVVRWAADEPDAPVVVAAHGITANGLAWARVVHHLAGRATVLAPDLRGRALSGQLPAPYGIGAHAADLMAVVEASGAEQVLLTGHSMGAFVSALTAARNPDRVAGLLLVDGGVGFPMPEHLPPDEMITAVIGPAMQRLTMTFPDRAAYRTFWQAHPAFAYGWPDWVDAYIQRDLVGEEPEMRSSCVLDAIRTDGMGQFEDGVLDAVHQLHCPARLLWAERGVMDEPQGLYSEERLAAAAIDPAALESHPVPDTNHFTLLLSDDGARLIAEHLLQLAGVASAKS